MGFGKRRIENMQEKHYTDITTSMEDMPLKRKILTVILAIALALAMTVPAALAGSVRILYERDDYQLAKYEPEKGTYLGAYIVQDVITNDDPVLFNEMTGKTHASFFRYVGYGRMVPQDWLDKVIAAGAAPHIALEPNNGLEEVQDDAYLRDLARQLASVEGPVFLRYASEMNGDWAAYSGDPELFVEKWKLVHGVMREEAPNVMMVWTVFTFPQNAILWYYPGDDYVDWVGVNIYNVVYHNNNLNHRADHQDPLELLDYVYDTFSHRKPIQISEYGATHYTTTDETEYVDFAVEKISRLYTGLISKYPRVKSIFYFNTNNLVNAPLGRRINDYSITNHEVVLEAYRQAVAPDHYLTSMGPDLEGTRSVQLFHLRSGFYKDNGTTLVSSAVLPEAFGVRTDWHRSVLVGDDMLIPFERSRVVVHQGRSHFPVRYLADLLGYELTYRDQKKLVILTLPASLTDALEETDDSERN